MAACPALYELTEAEVLVICEALYEKAARTEASLNQLNVVPLRSKVAALHQRGLACRLRQGRVLPDHITAERSLTLNHEQP